VTLVARWLGQAGFLLATDGQHLLVDPYLSDSLARKYAGELFPHVRMRSAPMTVDELPALLAVACSHAHTDHMDPDTLKPLLAAQVATRLVCPRAVAGEAMARSGVGGERIDALRAGESLTLGPYTVTAVPSAHEERVVDELGDDRFLGYVVATEQVRLYHSGDCVPWDGLVERLRPHAIDVALLPINGRDQHRRENGVPGNFTFAEAVALCQQTGIGTLVPHHWGMFDFNTVDPRDLDLDLADRAGVKIIVPEHGGKLDLSAMVS
jgi:L-ascorbate metabolism protein UlaG (beta-lactamase superfamily)